MAELKKRAGAIVAQRKVRLDWQPIHQTAAVTCNRQLSSLMSQAVKRHQGNLVSLHSGAGHDAAAMAAVTPVTMLFVRCKAGISHHPDESACVKDVRIAIAVLNDFIKSLN